MDNINNNYYQKPWKAADFNDPYIWKNQMDSVINDNFYVSASENTAPRADMNYTVSVPMSLAKSIEGKYFVGTSEDLRFGEVTNAWARLYNPPDSGVNLHVNVWTVSDIRSTPYRAGVWFNATPPGIIQESESITAANTSIRPLPTPKIKLQYAVGAKGLPLGGIRAFSRVGTLGISINSEEEGKFIFPPGGSFLIFLSNPEAPTQAAIGRVAFGWWEEPILP